ncbi:MAG: GNAT family N-acetyltransferase [Oxalobacteraceae bacterium]|nr:GNAT family N-acetyltransferase [Oxalobacteraceae bacterium]
MTKFTAAETLAVESSTESIYADCIPPFVERGLEDLYGSLYASLPQLQCDDLTQVHTYAAWRDDRLSAILLYCLDGSQIRVINEGMYLPPEELDRFANTLFAHYAKVSVISLHAQSVSQRTPQRPYTRMAVTEDIVIDLPGDEQSYLAQMGKSSRKSLKQHLLKARNELPGFHHTVVTGEAISETLVEQIIGFNHARMAHKQRRSAIDEKARTHLMRLLRARGWVGVISGSDRICAGTLACRFGDAVYSMVNAHDPQYNGYSMGNLSRYLLINASIRAGVHRFHLLGGQLSTKRKALGRRHKLYDIRLYRSQLFMAKDLLNLALLARKSLVYRLRTWLEDLHTQAHPGKIAHTVLSLQKALRATRSHLRRLSGSSV